MKNEINGYNDKINKEIEEYTLLRKITLNIFKGIFIIMSYFYFSETMGSISTNFVDQSQFSMQFGFTLLLFTFFSVLAGSFHGLINGFLGELFYQLAFYDTLELQWCFIVAILGFFVGIYKYSPLKFKDRIKIFYSFLSVLISSFLISGIVIVLQSFSYPNVSLEKIIVNFGFKFLTQSIISIIFIIPILLFLYNYFLAEKEIHFYHMSLTHHPYYACDHTYHLKFGRTYIYFCSRCSGAIIGGIVSLFFFYFFEISFNFIINPELAIIICLIFPIPCIIDWGTQKLLFRNSTTESRIITGFLVGISLYFLSFTGKYYFFGIFLVILYFSIVALIMYIGYQKELRKLREKDNDKSSQDGTINE